MKRYDTNRRSTSRRHSHSRQSTRIHTPDRTYPDSHYSLRKRHPKRPRSLGYADHRSNTKRLKKRRRSSRNLRPRKSLPKYKEYEDSNESTSESEQTEHEDHFEQNRIQSSDDDTENRVNNVNGETGSESEDSVQKEDDSESDRVNNVNGETDRESEDSVLKKDDSESDNERNNELSGNEKDQSNAEIDAGDHNDNDEDFTKEIEDRSMQEHEDSEDTKFEVPAAKPEMKIGNSKVGIQDVNGDMTEYLEPVSDIKIRLRRHQKKDNGSEGNYEIVGEVDSEQSNDEASNFSSPGSSAVSDDSIDLDEVIEHPYSLRSDYDREREFDAPIRRSSRLEGRQLENRSGTRRLRRSRRRRRVFTPESSPKRSMYGITSVSPKKRKSRSKRTRIVTANDLPVDWDKMGLFNADPDDYLGPRALGGPPGPENLMADVSPLDIDSSIDWDSVGGLDAHIRSLKEMVALPMMYPELFKRFNTTPPRGVLFYGPPGTGKTLTARALANTCSRFGKKVSFFMRKGADCLSKWVGEAERQLRLLFEQARKHQPSIIFFDEIDGLAPVRSSKQDQIHSSIVSTLLALMDGLDDRGHVIVIGATNRVDAIDPALRRPGRFDRELCFSLPTLQARRSILAIHTKHWNPPPDSEILKHLAKKTVGYCGADLRSLCTEVSLNAVRRVFPEVYEVSRKLKLDLDKLHIAEADFEAALNNITPASRRSAATVSCPLPIYLKPLLQDSLELSKQVQTEIFDPKDSLISALSRPRLLFIANGNLGQYYIAHAVLQNLEDIPVFSLDISALFGDPFVRSAEECCVRTLREARQNAPSIIYWPHMEIWWETASDSLRATVLTMLTDMTPGVLLISITDACTSFEDLPEALQPVFSTTVAQSIELTGFNEEQRKIFFMRLHGEINRICERASNKTKTSSVVVQVQYEPVAKSSLDKKNLDNSDMDEKVDDQAVLLRLRQKLRLLSSRLIKDFPEFRKSGDHSLLSILYKVNMRRIETVQSFLNEIDNLVAYVKSLHATEAVPDTAQVNRMCQLQDFALAAAYSFPRDLATSCEDVVKKRLEGISHQQQTSSVLHISLESSNIEKKAEELDRQELNNSVEDVNQRNADDSTSDQVEMELDSPRGKHSNNSMENDSINMPIDSNQRLNLEQNSNTAEQELIEESIESLELVLSQEDTSTDVSLSMYDEFEADFAIYADRLVQQTAGFTVDELETIYCRSLRDLTRKGLRQVLSDEI